MGRLIMKKLILGIMGIVVLVVLASGCVSSGTTNPKTDLETSGDINGQWNGPPNEWFVNGNVQSKSNTEYSNIQIQLTAYDVNNNIVGIKNTTVDSSGYFETIIKVKKEPDHVNMTVLNATPK
jgi:hypothetical protein